MILRDYQTTAIENLRDVLISGSMRPVIQAPTGAGKTVIAAAIVKMAREKGKRVLFCVPSISLIDQTVDRFRQNGIWQVGVIQAQHELTDPSQPVQVCSIQTLARRTIPPADLVIVDECHVMFKLYDRWMNHPDWQNIRFVGLTATPWAKGMGATGRWDKLIIGTTTKELIDKKHLSDFKVYAPAHPDLTDVKMHLGDYELKSLAAAMNKGKLVADIISTWLERGQDRSTICFAVDRLHAKTIQKGFVEAGVNAEYMDAFTDLKERSEIVDRFQKGEVKIICNVGVLTTGFDADVRCIILARPTKSEILYVQMIGRGLRTADGKDHCLILDHSDTTIRLGFVTDIHSDQLDDGKPKKKEAKPRVLLPKECPKCSFVKPPLVKECPSCGFKGEAKGKMECEAGELYEITRGKGLVAGKASPADMQRWFSDFVRYADLRGYKRGWAFHAFRDKFKMMPPSWLTATPSPMISPDIASWIKSRNIRQAKSRYKNGRVA